MLTNDGYALLIGVDDYSAYDRSMNLPPGASALLGSVNDVRAFWRICRKLEMKPERIRVLTSPQLDPGALEGAVAGNLGPATEEQILAGVRWLAERIAAEPRPSGLLCYSGHGDWIEGKGLAICPSDTVGANLEHAILFARLQAIVDAQRAGENLTMLLDTCHSGAAGTGRLRALTLSGRPLPAGWQLDVPFVGDRMMAATGIAGVACQAKFSGVWQGAFSFALGAALDQWLAVQDGPSVRLDVSYEQLVERVQRLLASLSFDQRPALRGRGDIARLAFLQRGTAPASTVDEPDAKRPGSQLDSGTGKYTIYNLSDTSSNYVGAAMAVGSSSYTYTVNGTRYTYTANMEYWSIPSNLFDNLNSPSSGDQITLDGTGGTQEWPTNAGAVPGFPVDNGTYTAELRAVVPSTAWYDPAAKGKTPDQVFIYTNSSSSPTSGLALRFSHLSYDSSKNQWGGHLNWYVIGTSAPSGPVMLSGTKTTLTFTKSNLPTPASGYYWWELQAYVIATVTFPQT